MSPYHWTQKGIDMGTDPEADAFPFNMKYFFKGMAVPAAGDILTKEYSMRLGNRGFTLPVSYTHLTLPTSDLV